MRADDLSTALAKRLKHRLIRLFASQSSTRTGINNNNSSSSSSIAANTHRTNEFRSLSPESPKRLPAETLAYLPHTLTTAMLTPALNLDRLTDLWIISRVEFFKIKLIMDEDFGWRGDAQIFTSRPRPRPIFIG